MKRMVLLLFIATLVAAFFALDLHRFLTLEAIKSSQDGFAAWYDARPGLVVGAFFAG